MVQLLMTWDVQPGQEDAHIEFIAKTFIPRMVRLGFRLRDVWSTLYGEAPQMSVGWLADDRSQLQTMVRSKEFTSLREGLEPYITDFHFRVAPLDDMF